MLNARSVARLVLPLMLAGVVSPSFGSSLWGATWGGYAGSDSIRLYEIDPASGQVDYTRPTQVEGSRAGAQDFASDPVRDPTTVWTLNRTERHGLELVSLNPYRPRVNSIVSLDATLDLRGLAIDPATGDFYATSPTALYRVDPNLGDATLVGTTDNDVSEALGFASNGELLGFGRGEQTLFSVDKRSGATLNSVPVDAAPADIAFRPEDGALFGLGFAFSRDYTYGLYQIDPRDGSVSHAGRSVGRPAGLAFTLVPEPRPRMLALVLLGGLAASNSLAPRSRRVTA